MNYPIIEAATKSIDSFLRKNYLLRASGLAFATILAIVPLVMVIIFFITFFPIFDNLVLLSENYLLENFVPSASLPLKNYFTVFIQQATTMPLGNILFLLITAMMLINTVERTLNFIWKVKKRRKKIFAILFYWSIILLTPIIIGISIFATSSILNIYWVMKITNLFPLKLIVDFILPIVINTFLFALLYIIVPNVRVIWQYGLLGAFLTAIIFNLTRLIFLWYITQFQSYSIIYGVFSVIPIFMVWLYIAWIIIIWGALFTYYLQSSRKRL